VAGAVLLLLLGVWIFVRTVAGGQRSLPKLLLGLGGGS
jgi:uncharacterized membrane protein